jgi:hypothetical protein
MKRGVLRFVQVTTRWMVVMIVVTPRPRYEGDGIGVGDRCRFVESQRFVHLDAQTPSWIAQAVAKGSIQVLLKVGTVQRLQEEVLEGQMNVVVRRGARLGVDQLEFVALTDHQFRVRLGADTDPIDAGRWHQRAVGLDRDDESAVVQRPYCFLVQLQQRFAAGADDESPVVVAADVPRPDRSDGIGQFPGRGKAAAARSIGPDKVGVTELADGFRAVSLPAAPQIAASEPAEHGGTARVRPFALQGEIDLLHCISHAQ